MNGGVVSHRTTQDFAFGGKEQSLNGSERLSGSKRRLRDSSQEYSPQISSKKKQKLKIHAKQKRGSQPMDLLNQIREIREQFDIHQRKRNKSGLNSINESVLSIQDSSGMVD